MTPRVKLKPSTVDADQKLLQEGPAVASIVRDNPSPLPDMHCDHNAPALLAVHAGALWAATTMRGKFGSEFET